MTMPVFVIKAKDRLAVDAVLAYRDLCLQVGLTDQAAEVDKALEEMRMWRNAHPGQIKDPDHRHIPAEEATATAVAIGEDGTAYLDDDTGVPAGEWEEATTR